MTALAMSNVNSTSYFSSWQSGRAVAVLMTVRIGKNWGQIQFLCLAQFGLSSGGTDNRSVPVPVS